MGPPGLGNTDHKSLPLEVVLADLKEGVKTGSYFILTQLNDFLSVHLELLPEIEHSKVPIGCRQQNFL